MKTFFFLTPSAIALALTAPLAAFAGPMHDSGHVTAVSSSTSHWPQTGSGYRGTGYSMTVPRAGLHSSGASSAVSASSSASAGTPAHSGGSARSSGSASSEATTTGSVEDNGTLEYTYKMVDVDKGSTDTSHTTYTYPDGTVAHQVESITTSADGNETFSLKLKEPGLVQTTQENIVATSSNGTQTQTGTGTITTNGAVEKIAFTDTASGNASTTATTYTNAAGQTETVDTAGTTANGQYTYTTTGTNFNGTPIAGATTTETASTVVP